MKYVYLENNIVVDALQTNPYIIFEKTYAEQFIEAPDEVTHFWKLEDGQWIAPPGPTVEEQWTQIRTQRNSLIQESDWVVIKATETKTEVPQEWLTYRQALRDITNYPTPEEVVWPIKPE